MRFEVLLRASTVDTSIATFAHHFDPPTDPTKRFDAVAFDGDTSGVAVPAATGDFLVLRFSVTSVHAPGTKQYVPNGDGPTHEGRIPSLRLPE